MISLFISLSFKGQQKSVLALGATQGVAYSRKVDFQSGYPRYHRLTKIHCPPGRYIETCSNDAKRRVHRNLHMNSGPLPEATPCVQTWSAKVHVYSCVSEFINRQPYKHLIFICNKDVRYIKKSYMLRMSHTSIFCLVQRYFISVSFHYNFF